MKERDQVDALLAAFERFCQETARLEASYATLKEELHAANLELEETNARLHSILSHITQGLLFLDLEGRIGTLNPAGEALLGLKHPEIEGKFYNNVFEDALFGFSMQKALKTRTAPPFSRISIGDKEIDVEAIFMEDGQGLIITLHDRTEMQRLALLASRHDRMQALGEMAAEVAHEIRNPLGGIKGFAALLKRDLKGSAQEKMIDFIIEGTDNLSHLVTQILNYSRPIKPHFTRFALNALIADTQALIELDSGIQPKPQFRIELSPPQLEVSLDESMMKGALLNLFVNSCQAMKEGGSIKIQGRLEKNELILDISDTGTGIPKELQEKLFSPFFTTKIGGTGLGLAEVHKIIQAHGGKIEVSSEVKKGTCFRIKIPQKESTHGT